MWLRAGRRSMRFCNFEEIASKVSFGFDKVVLESILVGICRGQIPWILLSCSDRAQRRHRRAFVNTGAQRGGASAHPLFENSPLRVQIVNSASSPRAHALRGSNRASAAYEVCRPCRGDVAKLKVYTLGRFLKGGCERP